MSKTSSFESQSLRTPPHSIGPVSLFFKSQFTRAVKLPSTLDLTGQTALVTGASNGLGLHACQHLLTHGLSHLIMAVRSPTKGEAVAASMRAKYPAAKVEVWELEMSSYESIQALVRRIEKDLARLDMAILNAGMIKQQQNFVKATRREEVLQVNYLSTVLLSILLLPALKTKSPPTAAGRLTIVGSGTAYQAAFPNRNEVPLLDSFDKLPKWDPNERYWVSKLLGHYFLVKLVEFVDKKDVIVNIVDPGLCSSDLLRDVTGIQSAIMTLMKWIMARTLEVGSTTYVDAAAVRGKESHGCYVMDWKIYPFASLLYASDSKAVTQQLWDETMKELEFAEPLKVLNSLRT